MARMGHKLSVIKASTIPEHLLFVDTETTPGQLIDGRQYHDLKLGVAIFLRYRRDGKAHQRRVYRFKTIEEFWGIVHKHVLGKTVLHLISHNAVFDFTVLEHMTNLESSGYDCKFVYDGGMRFISKWRKDKKTIVILNNANWFAGTLARWGKELNLPKLEMPKGLESEEKWFTYCERDAEILYQLFLWYAGYLLNNDLGKWKYTIASGALTAYRHRFMAHPIYIPDESADSDIARDSYHGGRTECFRIGTFTNGPFYKLDINSMYPYVMRNYQYPTCFEGRYENVPLGKLAYTLEKNCVIATVDLETSIPYFCHTIDGRNVYPIGCFTTALTTEELKLAISMDWVKKVREAVVYRARDIFTDYVDFFFRQKIEAGETSKPLLRAFAKLYLNALYGKFGQRGFVDLDAGYDETSCYRVSHGLNLRTGERFTLKQIGHKVLYSERSGESYNAFAAVASHVTANARMSLYDSILECNRKNVFYCDTDSIICTQLGYNNIKPRLDEQRLGAWKLEGVSDTLAILAPKHYQFGGKWTIKGIRKDAEKLSPGQYKQEIWPGYNTILNSGLERYFNYYQTKTLSPSIISGTVDALGYIHPFNLRKDV